MQLYQDLSPSPPVQITDDKAVVFVHIPKTAGTTLKNILFGKFPVSQKCAWDFMSDPFPDFTRCQFYYGHFYYPVIKQLLNRPAIYLSFFRDPIERSISHFYQLYRAVKDQSDSPQIKDLPQSLEAFIDSQYNTEIINLQTRFLITQLNTKERLHVSEFMKFQIAWGENTTLVHDGHRISAKAAYPVVDSLDFFGITEDFETSMALLSYTFGWEPIQTVESKNVGSYARPAKHIINKIIDLNQEDLKLYDYAKHVFYERVGQMRRDQQRLYYLTSRASTTPRSHTVHHIFDHVSGEGWYMPESRPEGLDFIWTGPGTCSTLELALANGQNLTLRCHVLAALQDDILTNLQISINGHPIELTYHPAAVDGGFEVEGVIPSAVIPRDRYFSTLTFSTPYTISPQDLEPENIDSRKLGVALTRLDISPAPSNISDVPAAAVYVSAPHKTWASRALHTLQVRLENMGAGVWSSVDQPDGVSAVKLGVYWVDNTGLIVPNSTAYTPLPRNLAPDHFDNLTLTVTAPSAPGEYSLYVNLLQSTSPWLDRWFKSAPAVLPIHVTG